MIDYILNENAYDWADEYEGYDEDDLREMAEELAREMEELAEDYDD